MKGIFIFLLVSVSYAFAFYKFNSITITHHYSSSQNIMHAITTAPYQDIIPYLSEHVQLADQMLFVGASSDLPIRLAKDGFGTVNTGYILIIDEDLNKLEECKQIALEDSMLSESIRSGKLRFEQVDYENMPQICKQSVFDSIVDYGGIDSILKGHSSKSHHDIMTKATKCIDYLQIGVRLGNILVSISTLEKEKFSKPFETRYGWVQELDGDPGEISAWYRGKSNILPSKSNFSKHGLKMYVYTNTDNC